MLAPSSGKVRTGGGLVVAMAWWRMEALALDLLSEAPDVGASGPPSWPPCSRRHSAVSASSRRSRRR